MARTKGDGSGPHIMSRAKCVLSSVRATGRAADEGEPAVAQGRRRSPGRPGPRWLSDFRGTRWAQLGDTSMLFAMRLQTIRDTFTVGEEAEEDMGWPLPTPEVAGLGQLFSALTSPRGEGGSSAVRVWPGLTGLVRPSWRRSDATSLSAATPPTTALRGLWPRRSFCREPSNCHR